MAYTLTIPADIGTTGLTLLASFINTSGTLHATLRNLATTEIGTSGAYRFTSSSIDDGYRGQVVFHTGSITALGDLTTSNFYALAGINPQETENADVATSSISGGAGSGARTVTVTVDDDGTLLQNAAVRMTEGVNTFIVLTNASGVAVFQLDDATYAIAVSKSGYEADAGNVTSVVVNGDETVALEMNAIVISAPADPLVCRLYGHLVLPGGGDASSVQVKATLVGPDPATVGSNIVASRIVKTETDAAGDFQLDLIRTDVLDQTCTWDISCKVASIDLSGIVLTTSTKDIADLL